MVTKKGLILVSSLSAAAAAWLSSCGAQKTSSGSDTRSNTNSAGQSTANANDGSIVKPNIAVEKPVESHVPQPLGACKLAEKPCANSYDFVAVMERTSSGVGTSKNTENLIVGFKEGKPIQSGAISANPFSFFSMKVAGGPDGSLFSFVTLINDPTTSYLAALTPAVTLPGSQNLARVPVGLAYDSDHSLLVLVDRGGSIADPSGRLQTAPCRVIVYSIADSRVVSERIIDLNASGNYMGTICSIDGLTYDAKSKGFLAISSSYEELMKFSQEYQLSSRVKISGLFGGSHSLSGYGQAMLTATGDLAVVERADLKDFSIAVLDTKSGVIKARFTP